VLLVAVGALKAIPAKHFALDKKRQNKLTR